MKLSHKNVTNRTHNLASIAVKFFLAGVKAVSSEALVHRYLSVANIKSETFLHILNFTNYKRGINEKINISQPSTKQYVINKNVHVVGFGKAVLGMTRAITDLLGHHVVSGVISVPYGSHNVFSTGTKYHYLSPTSPIKVYEGAENNIPDDAALSAARKIHALAQSLDGNHLLLVVISGGGSALLPLPHDQISLAELSNLTQLLSKRGATINDLNIVRSHLEQLKGGGLALAAYPCEVISLILSDIMGDPLHLIASGPTVSNFTSVQDCRDTLNKYVSEHEIPGSVITYLQSHTSDNTTYGEFYADERENLSLRHVTNLLVGNNSIAIQGVKDIAEDYGFLPYVLSTIIHGEAREVGKFFGYLAWYVTMLIDNTLKNKLCELEEILNRQLPDYRCGIDSLTELKLVVERAIKDGNAVCVISGGETTVTIRGTGKGGRNQEMALSAAIEMDKLFNTQYYQGGTPSCIMANIPLSGEGMNVLASHTQRDNVLQHNPWKERITFLSAGTDGIDGPTDAAGAVISSDLCDCAQKNGISAEDYLNNNDAYTFFNLVNSGSNLIKVGHTGTNVMDIQILLIKQNV